MTLSPALRGVVRSLEAREVGPLTPATLAYALRHAVGIDDVAPFIRFDSVDYVRSLVKKNDSWELRLLCWRPHQRTSVHGHGRSSCAFRILRGSGSEMVLGERDRTWTPGMVVDESAPNLIHQLANTGSDPLLTLHAYSPPLPIDAPSPRRGREVVIVGGGFAGVALAFQLLKRGSSDLRISIVERGPWVGRGVAYGVDSSIFRLNVPAARMSIDPELPDDFVRWARAEDQPHAFLERNRYGSYVVERLGGVIQNSRAKLRIFRSDAVDVDGTTVHLATGETLRADVVVLATGLAPRMVPGWLVEDPRIVDAWDECALATLPADGRLLVLGAGLSALDIVSLLDRRNYRGHLTILSRNGLLPRPHLEPFVPARALASDEIAVAPRSLRGLIRWIRSLVVQAQERGEPWQHAIDSIRPHTGRIWAGLSPAERASFAGSVRPFWDVLRHRAPVETLARIERLREENRFELLAGRALSCEADERGLEVDLRLRNGDRSRRRFDAVIRCIGPALENSETETPLLRSLLGAGHAMRDPSGLGIMTDDNGALVDNAGRPSETYFALGAHRRASSWESTSVPDIAVHAQRLAAHLAP